MIVVDILPSDTRCLFHPTVPFPTQFFHSRTHWHTQLKVSAWNQKKIWKREKNKRILNSYDLAQCSSPFHISLVCIRTGDVMRMLNFILTIPNLLNFSIHLQLISMSHLIMRSIEAAVYHLVIVGVWVRYLSVADNLRNIN